MTVKFCGKCAQSKPVSKFWKNRKTVDGLQGHCKICLATANKAVHARRRKLVVEYLQAHPCEDCGETDPVVLEFDHVGDKTKGNEVGRLISDGAKMCRVMAEITKCEVRCANCHRRKTATDRNWYPWLR